ncbi:MAG: hypothetical protein H0T47_13740 [Planctomycetaceae bacterium]|nr:hypothetical protein [Planctomycetaceae bacterium]
MDLLPHAFLFRFAVPVPYAAGLPKRGRWLFGDDVASLPLFSAMDEATLDVVVKAAWNENGFGVAAEVTGKSMPSYAQPDDPAAGDGLHVWIDTRNTQGAHRAGKFCHRFAVLPAIGRGKSATPGVRAVEIPRARDATPTSDLELVRLASEVTKGGYRIEAWFPRETLHGFDPESSPKLGFHAVVKDSELGDRSLTVGDAFPTDHDPSMWTTLELIRP